MSPESDFQINVSVVLPVYNASQWLEDCLQSVISQEFSGSLELSIYDDGSTDKSKVILQSWQARFEDHGMKFSFSSGCGPPKGVGYAKNQAVNQSSGEYLCFLDADDVMACNRVQKQYDSCVSKNMIVGSRFHREPSSSTPRYTSWANNLNAAQLYTQIYTAFGPTIIMPTWFCHRNVFTSVDGFDERGKGVPEDLIFFYKHLQLGGQLLRVDTDLLLYRYHPNATTFSISEDVIWKVRMEVLEERVLKEWPQFTIWSAGKQGRKFFRTLSQASRSKVQAFCDVDVKKLSKGVYIYEECEIIPRPKIPIVHFSSAKPPFIICVKLNMTAGAFEENLASLNLIEGKDYFHFS